MSSIFNHTIPNKAILQGRSFIIFIHLNFSFFRLYLCNSAARQCDAYSQISNKFISTQALIFQTTQSIRKGDVQSIPVAILCTCVLNKSNVRQQCVVSLRKWVLVNNKIEMN